MATEILRPIADDTNYGTPLLSFTGAATRWECVDEGTANTTDYLFTPVDSFARAYFTVPANSIPAGSTINSVTVTVRMNRVSGLATKTCYVYYTDTRINVGEEHPTACTATAGYVNRARTWTGINNLTGYNFNKDDIDNMGIGVVDVDYSPNAVGRITQIWLTIDYTAPAPSSNNIFLLG